MEKTPVYPLAPLSLAKQLTLSHPSGQIMPTTAVLQAPQDFPTLRHDGCNEDLQKYAKITITYHFIKKDE